jgi:WD40 repeat protein
VANPIWIWNFDRQHNNYSLLGSAIDGYYGYGNKVIAVSPDGNWLFVPGDEAIEIFDINQVLNGQSSPLTNIASYHGPSVMAVSPVTLQDRVRRLFGGTLRNDLPTPRLPEEEKPVGER